jgi:hypothetical protein
MRLTLLMLAFMLPRNRIAPEPNEGRQRRVFRVVEATAVLDAQDANDEDGMDSCWKAENAVLQLQNTLLVNENKALAAEIQVLTFLRKGESDDYARKKETDSNTAACLGLQVELMQSRVAMQNSEFDDLRSRYDLLVPRHAALTAHIAMIKKENTNLVRENGLLDEKCALYRSTADRFRNVIRDQSARSVKDALEIDRLKREVNAQSQVMGTLDARLRDRVGELNALLQEHAREVEEAHAAGNIQLQARLAEHVENWKALYEIVRCPIGQELMLDPVVIANGVCIDRHRIVSWFGTCRGNGRTPTCPMTRDNLSDLSLRKVLMLKQISIFITEKADRMGIVDHMSS